jgi:type II secretion system protein N
MDEIAAASPSAGLMRGRWAMIAASILLGATVFAAFLVADFPYGDTLTALLAPNNLKLTYQSQRLSLPIGAKLTDVRLFSTLNNGDKPLLESPTVTLSPTIASLLFGRPGMHVRADLYNGDVRVTVHQHAGAVDLNFDLSRLDLGQIAPLKALGVVLHGNLSGTGTAQLNGPTLPDDHAKIAVSGDNLQLSVVNGFPAIHVGTLTGNIELEQGALKLSDVVAHGEDLDLTGDGTIQLGQTADDSTIDLTFTLSPTQSGRDHFGFFLKFMPHRPGRDSPYTVQGPLLSPSIN